MKKAILFFLIVSFFRFDLLVSAKKRGKGGVAGAAAGVAVLGTGIAYGAKKYRDNKKKNAEKDLLDKFKDTRSPVSEDAVLEKHPHLRKTKEDLDMSKYDLDSSAEELKDHRRYIDDKKSEMQEARESGSTAYPHKKVQSRIDKSEAEYNHKVEQHQKKLNEHRKKSSEYDSGLQEKALEMETSVGISSLEPKRSLEEEFVID
jgi:hypothetical protein